MVFLHARSLQQDAEATTRFAKGRVFSFAHHQATAILIHGVTALMRNASQLLQQELIQ